MNGGDVDTKQGQQGRDDDEKRGSRHMHLKPLVCFFFFLYIYLPKTMSTTTANGTTPATRKAQAMLTFLGPQVLFCFFTPFFFINKVLDLLKPLLKCMTTTSPRHHHHYHQQCPETNKTQKHQQRPSTTQNNPKTTRKRVGQRGQGAWHLKPLSMREVTRKHPRDVVRHLLGMWYVFFSYSFLFYGTNYLFRCPKTNTTRKHPSTAQNDTKTARKEWDSGGKGLNSRAP